MGRMKIRVLHLLCSWLVVLMACGQAAPTGSAQVVASLQQSLSATDVTRVQVTVSAADMAPRSVELVKTEGKWAGILGELPAGMDRTFSARAFGSDGTALYGWDATGVTITAGQVSMVSLILQELNPPPPFENAAPCIGSLIANPSTVEPGGEVTLLASAKDVNPGDTLTYAWTAAAGSFSASTSSSTSWTAPSSTGPVVLTLTVTDSKGATATVSLTITVRPGRGGAAVDISLNTWPQVSTVNALPSAVRVGEPTSVTAVASDVDGDALTYLWNSSCKGTFGNAHAAATTFTPSEQPSGETCANCTLSVRVEDGRGGHTTGSFAFCVGDKPTARFPPEIVETFQSVASAKAGGSVVFRVKAEDPQASALTFSWSASVGLISTPSSTSNTSDVVWRAPACTPTGDAAVISMTVKNALGLSASTSFQVSGGTVCTDVWTPTGSLLRARSAHTTEVLASGKVLAVGGIDAAEALASSELYDASTGRWSSTGSMTSPRFYHATVLLASGKVLAVGGYDNNYNVLASAELYDPATGKWTRTGSMTSARALQTLSILRSGWVLATGGYNGADALSSAELYNPATGTWSTTGMMSFSHYQHTATVLPSGEVLVIGGSNDVGPIANAELYNPVSGGWSVVGSMTSARYSHTTTLLATGAMLVAGGSSDGVNTLSSVDLQDSPAAAWRSGGRMASTRAMHASSVLQNKVLVMGGMSGSLTLSSTELYDVAKGTWSQSANMAQPRYQHTASVLPSGKVLICGGLGAGGSMSSAELYTP
ncbi:Kelch repeat-containing protein [Melittangium boletus]|uniref:Branched-chain amino acid ABC transporter substrate-binding protein n=1 Tax=Melittangium boletus DSM 14713 TaxID=1294270 RepID=A0A250IEA7_9BACT|nr:kelch motif-containing protein [Melittangium boletus]ATB30169.1 branched-chain amino acid ABC transporter substrate-binding protein [Melittangium boletus DSM 14713]